MTTSLRRVDYDDTLPMLAGEDITQYSPVYLSGENTVKIAMSPAHHPVIGVALHAKSAGQHIDVARFESIVSMTADGAIAAGSLVRASTTSGRITGVSGNTGAPGALVGIAMESAAGSGSVIGVLIAPQELLGALGPFRVMVADGAITAGRIVKVGSANNKVAQCAGASPTSNIVGVALNTAVDGANVVVALSGSVAPVTSGAAFSRGAYLTTDASGKAIAAAPAAGTNCAIVGIAYSAATAADETQNVLVSMGAIQG